MSVLPCDLLGESGFKIGKVCEVGEKSVGDKCECGGRVGGLLMVELGVLGGLNCSAFSLGCAASKHNGGPGPVDQKGVSFAEVSNGTALISWKGKLTAVMMMWFKWLMQMADWAIVDSVRTSTLTARRETMAGLRCGIGEVSIKLYSRNGMALA